MKKILIILALLHLPTNAKADDGIGNCFEAKNSNTVKYKCMIEYVGKYDNAIKVIENDINQMIIHNKYIEIPQYTESKNATDNIRRHNFIETQIINEEKLLETADMPLQKDFILHKSYELQKQYALTQLRQSTELFNSYKEAECERVKSKYTLEKHQIVANYHKNLCMYKLMKERIDALQESIK